MSPGSRSRRLAVCGTALALLCWSHTAGAAYAIAQYGKPKYPPGFTHFDYVNPDAPKRGTLVLANPGRLSSFDKYNPYTLRGTAAPGVDTLFESLTIGSADEVSSAYGLLADDIQVAADGMSASFHINPLARFSNGDAVTAADVKYSFDTLVGPKAAPALRAYLGDIARAVVVAPLTIRFDFKRRAAELPLLAGSVPVFSRKWGLRPDGSRISFDQLAFEEPIGSGPYLIEHADNGRGITYRLDPRYWGTNLPVRRGTNNFQHLEYKLYGDGTARLEAFKAGEFDATVEYTARAWVRSYVGKRFADGEIVKGEFRQHNGTGMQGFVMNLRRPLFQDPRVRRALDLAFDFEWLNRQLFYDQYVRLDSYFANGDFAARGVPSAGELALLAPWRAQLSPAVFGPAQPQPSTKAPHSLRENLRAARSLLAEAGWTYRDGALRNAQGRPFVFEILDDSGSAMAPVATPYIRNLQKLGITARFRTSDSAVLQKRLNTFDFDMTSIRYPDVQSPGAEEITRFGSAAAGEQGSDNLMGVRSPVVDALVAAVVNAHSREDLVVATRALDRVLMQGYYVVPHWYSITHRIAYRSTLAHPATLPLYYTAENWLTSMWWDALPAPTPAAATVDQHHH
jgi:microcin C transport system substrate-binding protein